MSLPRTPSFKHHYHNRIHLYNKSKVPRCYLFLLLIRFQYLELRRTYKKERGWPALSAVEASLVYAVRSTSKCWYSAIQKRELQCRCGSSSKGCWKVPVTWEAAPNE